MCEMDTGKSTAHLGDGKRRRRGEGVGKDCGCGVKPICQLGVILSIRARRTIRLRLEQETHHHGGIGRTRRALRHEREDKNVAKRGFGDCRLLEGK
jgi:hypothetical protein